MATNEKPMPSTFKVLIEDITLSAAAVAAIEAKIKLSVMAELAKFDPHGDLKAQPLPTARGFGGGGDGGATGGMRVGRE